jgi:hypothetical protein
MGFITLSPSPRHIGKKVREPAQTPANGAQMPARVPRSNVEPGDLAGTQMFFGPGVKMRVRGRIERAASEKPVFCFAGVAVPLFSYELGI